MKQILCFGDSNTYGLVPKENSRYGWGVRWTSLLDEAVRPYGYRVAEEGLCGRTTVFEDVSRVGRKGSDVLPVALETHSPVDAVVLMLGTNDCKIAYNTTAEKIGAGIEQLLDQIEAQLASDKILLISPIALGEKVWMAEYDPEFDRNSVAVSKELPRVYEKIARRRGVHFLRASDYAGPSRTDQEHLNAEGHERLAQGIVEKLQEVLKLQKRVA